MYQEIRQSGQIWAIRVPSEYIRKGMAPDPYACGTTTAANIRALLKEKRNMHSILAQVNYLLVSSSFYHDTNLCMASL